MISFTEVFSKLHRLTEDGELSHRSPKILGMDEFERVAETVEVDDLESSKYNKKSTDIEEYEELFQDTGENGGENL